LSITGINNFAKNLKEVEKTFLKREDSLFSKGEYLVNNIVKDFLSQRLESEAAASLVGFISLSINLSEDGLINPPFYARDARIIGYDKLPRVKEKVFKDLIIKWFCHDKISSFVESSFPKLQYIEKVRGITRDFPDPLVDFTTRLHKQKILDQVLSSIRNVDDANLFNSGVIKDYKDGKFYIRSNEDSLYNAILFSDFVRGGEVYKKYPNAKELRSFIIGEFRKDYREGSFSYLSAIKDKIKEEILSGSGSFFGEKSAPLKGSSLYFLGQLFNMTEMTSVDLIDFIDRNVKKEDIYSYYISMENNGRTPSKELILEVVKKALLLDDDFIDVVDGDVIEFIEVSKELKDKINREVFAPTVDDLATGEPVVPDVPLAGVGAGAGAGTSAGAGLSESTTLASFSGNFFPMYKESHEFIPI
jgi:hypothetical protein